jgi:hypothetical protein
MSRSAWPTHLIRTLLTPGLALLVSCLLLAATKTPDAAAQEPPAAPEAVTAAETTDAELAKRYEEFGKRLSGSTMHGFFSVDDGGADLTEDRYEIKSVTKLPNGELWLFNVRIRYGDHDVTAPLPLTVSWAGKTPVIVVDRLTIPGMGTFDARVVIADQRYAGTWQHGEAGGHLFGKIVPAGEAVDEPAADTQPAADEPPSAAPPDETTDSNDESNEG